MFVKQLEVYFLQEPKKLIHFNWDYSIKAKAAYCGFFAL
ncbi:Uncharacterised protein [Actinobacillus pleuropneumoniae]|nr:Uncharacterised protein [Actinobacillus pleuropneumoniae]